MRWIRLFREKLSNLQTVRATTHLSVTV